MRCLFPKCIVAEVAAAILGSAAEMTTALWSGSPLSNTGPARRGRALRTQVALPAASNRRAKVSDGTALDYIGDSGRSEGHGDLLTVIAAVWAHMTLRMASRTEREVERCVIVSLDGQQSPEWCPNSPLARSGPD